jgi:hypothetical protein
MIFCKELKTKKHRKNRLISAKKQRFYWRIFSGTEKTLKEVKKSEFGAFLMLFLHFYANSMIMQFGKIFSLIFYGIRTYVALRGFSLCDKLYEHLQYANEGCSTNV